jgi:hypothetical protein
MPSGIHLLYWGSRLDFCCFGIVCGRYMGNPRWSCSLAPLGRRPRSLDIGAWSGSGRSTKGPQGGRLAGWCPVEVSSTIGISHDPYNSLR